MTPDAILTLEKIMDFCNSRWVAAAEESPSGFPTADMLTGKKMAYNEMLQFTRALIADAMAK